MPAGSPRPPRAPTGLGTRGRRLWKAVVAEYAGGVADLEILTEACRTADLVDRLETAVAAAPVVAEGSKGQPVAHPLLRELRDARRLYAQLLAQLGIVGDGGDDGSWDDMNASQRGRKAARARWDGRGRSG